MGTVHKLSMDFYEETIEPYGLLAIHSTLVDYALAYALNHKVGFKLERTSWDLDLGKANFPVFEWRDEQLCRTITLIGNIYAYTERIQGEGLFGDGEVRKQYELIPELKKVDFFLKIENDTEENEETILQQVLTIPKIVTAYQVAEENLKSKNNLIF